MEIIFGGIMLVGVLYLLLMIFGGIGDAFDFGVDGALESVGLDGVFGLGGADVGDASGLGCSVLAAFLAGFGAMGLTGVSAGWSLPIMIALALVVGWGMARVVVVVMRYVLAQQSTEIYTIESTIGKSARVTIDSPAGKTGEVMIEDAHVMKYPVQEIDGRALKRGDLVEVVDISGRFLRVKKK
ncbi:MAG: hypothetical protein RLP44_24735 [Aggregatilineales bacterium]